LALFGFLFGGFLFGFVVGGFFVVGHGSAPGGVRFKSGIFCGVKMAELWLRRKCPSSN
jgi:hypothetical protein